MFNGKSILITSDTSSFGKRSLGIFERDFRWKILFIASFGSNSMDIFKDFFASAKRLLKKNTTIHKVLIAIKQCAILIKNRNVCYFLYDSYARIGYAKSIKDKAPLDADGQAIPWYTYPAIEYLSQLNFSQKRVFEYGAGYSTVFWSKRAGEVISIDNNSDWVSKVREMVPSRVLYATDSKTYTESIASYGLFDVVIIDGRFRNACTAPAMKALAPGGMVLVDNSDWSPLITRTLRENGFIQVDWHGVGPGNLYRWTTSIFFRGAFGFYSSASRFPLWPAGGLQDTYGSDE